MSTIGIIPARYASTRLPGKSLVELCGKPLIQWVYERARQADLLDDLVVATDDTRIQKVVEGFGGRAVLTRPEHPSGTDRIAEAMRGSKADVVINIQGDEPLIDPKLINALAKVMKHERRWDMATAACPLGDKRDLANPSVVKVVWGMDGQALYFSRAPIPFVRDVGGSDVANLHWRHIGLYGYRRDFLEKLVETPPCQLEKAEMLEQLRALYLGCRMYVIQTEHAGLGVDTPDDVPRAELALRRAGLAD